MAKNKFYTSRPSLDPMLYCRHGEPQVVVPHNVLKTSLFECEAYTGELRFRTIIRLQYVGPDLTRLEFTDMSRFERNISSLLAILPQKFRFASESLRSCSQIKSDVQFVTATHRRGISTTACNQSLSLESVQIIVTRL